MLTPGNPAPRFDCQAVLDQDLVNLHWNRLHEGRTLVLQFDSVENDSDWPDDLVGLSHCVEDFERLEAKVALVCRDHVFEILEWAGRLSGEGGPGQIAFPIIVDRDDQIASMYDMLNAEGCPLWGHVIIDPVGRVRHVAMSSCHIGPNVDELIRCVTSISNEQS
jgi:alkyl hydroperoxide reductase subunit AhpC